MTDHFSDRSRTESDNRCERQLFHGYYNGGRGYTPVGGKFDLECGKAIHAHVEGVDDTENLTAVHDSLVNVETPDGWNAYHEACALHKGLTETYTRFLKPQLEAEYELVASEVEMTMELAPGIQWMSRLDGILRRRSDGLYFVLECKTTDDKYTDDLMGSSRTNFQLLMECEALRRHLLELRHYLELEEGKIQPTAEVGGAVLLVFNKGNKKKATEWEEDHGKTGRRRLSPFTYWHGKSLADGSMEYQLEWTNKKGFERIPTWTIPGWYDILMENEKWREVAKLQVQLWPSVDFDEVRTASVIRQVVSRERRVAHYKAQAAALPADSSQQPVLVDTYFSQDFTNCLNDGGFRKRCAAYDLCHSPNVARDPLSSGLYEVRVPNHPQEAQQ